MACDSEWTYCLEQNKTKRATCVGSCLSNNGGCNDDSVCITTFSRDRFDLQCVDYDGECMNEMDIYVMYILYCVPG